MSEKGFALLEIIAAIMLIGIAAALLTGSGSQWSHTSPPLNTIADNYAVARAIEIVNADYRYRLSNDSSATLAYLSNIGEVNGLPLDGVNVSAEVITFSGKDKNITGTVDSSGTIDDDTEYILITAQKNNSQMVTLLGS